jgi:hypothetical protein
VSREKSDSSSGGLQIQTLLISAVSAVVAATVVPMFWAKGTVIATAMTPVIVALVAEALRHPVQKVSAAAPRVSTAVRRFQPAEPVEQAVRGRPRPRVSGREPDPHDFRPVPDPGAEEPIGVSADDPFGLREPPRRRSWWKAGIVTGLLAFVLAAAVVTASELAIFGGSVSGDRGRTTLFGGKTSKEKPSSDHKSKDSSSPEQKATATPQATASPQATTTPAPSATPSATPTTTPAPTPQGAAPSATPTP